MCTGVLGEYLRRTLVKATQAATEMVETTAPTNTSRSSSYAVGLTRILFPTIFNDVGYEKIEKILAAGFCSVLAPLQARREIELFGCLGGGREHVCLDPKYLFRDSFFCARPTTFEYLTWQENKQHKQCGHVMHVDLVV